MMLTVLEAAARLGRDPGTIRRWIRSGKLRARKVGTRRVINEQDIQPLVELNTLRLPRAWRKTSTGEPMPNVRAALRRSRLAR